MDLRSTVIIMTSNIGSTYPLDAVTSGGATKPDARQNVVGELRAGFRPESLNRVEDRAVQAAHPPLGRLLAAHEHKFFTQAVIWRIESFGPCGTELGKIRARASSTT